MQIITKNIDISISTDFVQGIRAEFFSKYWNQFAKDFAPLRKGKSQGSPECINEKEFKRIKAESFHVLKWSQLLQNMPGAHLGSHEIE